MSDQLYLSYRLRGFTESNMLRHYERMLPRFPFSRLAGAGGLLRVFGVSWSEPPLLEIPIVEPGPDFADLVTAAKEFLAADGAVQLEAYWDLWQFQTGWSVQPARVLLNAFGPEFESETEDHVRIDFGVDTYFLPIPGLLGSNLMIQSNIRSLLRLTHDLDETLNVASRRLWTESGENFADRLQETLESASLNS